MKETIRLIMADVDGTLLTDNKLFPPDMFNILEKLNKKGVFFVPESGRQICSLERFFAPYSENMALIAENGGLHKSVLSFLCISAKK